MIFFPAENYKKILGHSSRHLFLSRNYSNSSEGSTTHFVRPSSRFVRQNLEQSLLAARGKPSTMFTARVTRRALPRSYFTKSELQPVERMLLDSVCVLCVCFSCNLTSYNRSEHIRTKVKTSIRNFEFSHAF